MRALLIACVLAVSAAAQEAAARDNACGQIPVTAGREVEPFSTWLPAIDSAQSLPKEGVFTLRLIQMSEVIYPVTPDRGADSGYGGFVTIESLPVGRYRILLSDVAWLDAVLDNQRLPILAFDRSDDCPGVRQIMEFDVTSQPLVLQVSGAPAPFINIAIRRVWEFEWRW
jgi:hypothetical protein